MTLAAPALAQESQGGSTCGEIKAFTAATPTTDGSVTIGSRTVVLKADELYSQMAQNRMMLEVGRQICLNGSVNAAGEYTQYIAIALPSPLCGHVMAFTAPTASAAGSVSIRHTGIATLVIPAGTEVGTVAMPTDTPPTYTCFHLGLDADGNAVVTGRQLSQNERTAAMIHICGVVLAWTEPTRVSATLWRHEEPGSITIADRVVPIAAGTEYHLVNSAPIVGQATCLNGWLDSAGAAIAYVAQPGLPRCIGGKIGRYEAPTEAADGLLQFAPGGQAMTPDSNLFRIPAGTDMPDDAATWHYCFLLKLDDAGRAVVVGAVYEGTATRPGATGPSQLPSTSTR